MFTLCGRALNISSFRFTRAYSVNGINLQRVRDEALPPTLPLGVKIQLPSAEFLHLDTHNL